MNPQRSLPAWSVTASRARCGGSAFCGAWTRCRPAHGSKRAFASSTPPPSAGDRPYPPALRLRIHGAQLFSNPSDRAMEDAPYDSAAVQRRQGVAQELQVGPGPLCLPVAAGVGDGQGCLSGEEQQDVLVVGGQPGVALDAR